MIFKRHRTKPTPPVSSEIRSTPETERFDSVANKLAEAFGLERMQDPDSFPSRLISGLSMGLPRLFKGQMASGRASVEADTAEGTGSVAALTSALGVELPEAGLAGLRLLVHGLREQGGSRVVEAQPVRHWREQRINDRDVLPFITEPTLLTTKGTSIETLALPSSDPNVVVTFGGLGVMHPGSDPAEPVLAEIVIMPDAETGQNYSSMTG